MRLNLGCGHVPKAAGVIGLDIVAWPTVDVVHDCEVIPWPFTDAQFQSILAWHLFEHLKPWRMVDVMNECWRVLQSGGLLKIGMPAPNSFGFYQDPTHIRTWNEVTPRYFDPDYTFYKIYEPKPWKIMVNETYQKALPLGVTSDAYNGSLRIVLEKRGLN